VSSYVDALPSSGGVGPLGVAVDAADNLWFVDGGQLYVAAPGTNHAGGITRVGSKTAANGVVGLAFGKDGSLYAARQTTRTLGDIVSLDQATGSVERLVAHDVPCPKGLAVDPLSGDIFFSTQCGHGIRRVTRAGSSRLYADVFEPDGLTFGDDGTLYIAHAADGDGSTVAAVTGTAAAHPGFVRELAAVPTADGLGVARSAPGAQPAFLVVNRNDGKLTRVDLAGAFPTTTDLFTGGSRGDFVAVDGAGCLFATQSDEILRVTNVDGRCGPAPTPAGPGDGPDPTPAGLGAGLISTTVTIRPSAAALIAAVAGPRSVCSATRRLTLQLRIRGGVRLVAVAVYLHGKRLTSIRAPHRVPRTVKLAGLPRGRFTLRIHARTSTGKLMKVTRHFAACRATTSR
jgi:DNA-binding beta-propeller fold protein YncE